MLSLKKKVYAYITHANRLLVFAHVDAPEAGIQVPGGTVEDAELPDQAVMRESLEETGLTDLRIGVFLGDTYHVFPDREIAHHRHYYHLVCADMPLERWRHDELDPSDGSPAPIPFEFYWVALPDGIPELSGGLDEMVPELCRYLELAQPGESRGRAPRQEDMNGTEAS